MFMWMTLEESNILSRRQRPKMQLKKMMIRVEAPRVMMTLAVCIRKWKGVR